MTFLLFSSYLQQSDVSVSEELAEVKRLLQVETQLRKAAEEDANKLKSQLGVRIISDYKGTLSELSKFHIVPFELSIFMREASV